MKIEKAIEISDAKIQFISLVDKAANKRQFLITKAENGDARFSSLGKIVKFDSDTHYVTGVVYEPLTEDAHGNYMTENEIRKAAYWFAKNGDKVDLQHSFEQANGVAVVETYVAPADMNIEGQPVTKGAWLMTVEVDNPEIWDKVQKGELTGFSMGGVGKYAEKETDVSDKSEKRGLFKRLAELFGFSVVEKGEVTERYNRDIKNDNFWNAFYALENTLCKYDWRDDIHSYETDETVIREALSEFSEIIVSLLAAPSVVTVLAQNAPVEKSGRKISGKNHETLKSIYDNLGALLDEFTEQPKGEEATIEKEEKDLTKDEIKKLVDEAVRDALSDKDKKKDDDKQTPTQESVEKMVNEAVKKALEPKAEQAVTPEAVRKMVDEAVTKAVEPILKARGLPNNLNGEKPVEKTEKKHYLAGLL